ncbi:MAG: cation transporting ATPase C-terminal domain-containing protein [Gemmatimonadales bacterium]
MTRRSFPPRAIASTMCICARRITGTCARFVTFAVLLLMQHATPAAFRTGGFIESLTTQTLVLLVNRTTEKPFRNRPSAALAVAVLGALVVGAVIPFSPLGSAFGFNTTFAGLLGVRRRNDCRLSRRNGARETMSDGTIAGVNEWWTL